MTSLRTLTLLLVLSVVLVYVAAAVLPSNTTTTTKAPATTKPKTTKAPRTTKTTTTKAPKTIKTTTTKAPPTTKTTTTKAPRTTKTTTTKKTQLTTNPETTTTTTTTTPKPTNCEDLVNPADSNSCLFCWCFEGDYQCSLAPCVRPMCVDSVSLPGACCPVCPNGDNCEVNGNIIPVDQTVSIEGIGECYCVMDGSYGMRAECVPVTPPMTTPNACDENVDNTDPCYKCTCENNEKQCYHIDCFFDPCVDGYYEPGVCCKICPNGRNCVVGGTIIPDGTSVVVEGYGECYCSMDYNTFRLSATCNPFTGPPPTTPQTPPMTTPWLPSTPGCDETLDNSDPCFVCECYNNERQCYVIDCAPIGCVDGYKNPGDCCTKCPNGNNCAVDGTIIHENSRVYVDGHGECYCVINFEKYRLEAECVPPTDFPHTTPWLPPSTPASCEGLTNPAAGNPCMYCYCMNGIYECIIGDCGMPRCFDSVREPGACCSTCPNGENCEYGGSIIPYGQTVDVPFLGTCTCAENHYTGELLAQCIPFEPTTPPDPPTTPTGCYDGYVDSDDPCRRCECDGDQLMCYNIPCAWGKCVDGYTEPGQCCPTCPNGRNCKANGVIIPYGTPVLIEGIGYCYCVDETSTYWQGGVEVECLPLSTTPFTTPHTTPAMTTLYHEETTPVTPPQTTPATDAPWWETSQAPWEDTTTDPPPQGEVSSRPARSIREAVRRLMAKR